MAQLGTPAGKRALFPPRYEPKTRLGKGGGGEVWAVFDRITGATLALKVLDEDAHEREVEALVREAVALSGVEGLGVPRVLRFGRLPGSGRAYLVRELVEGRSLADLLEEGDTMRGIDAVARAIDQLTRLHRALLLHGDLKPANIIVGDDGRATLVDLGLAAAFREGGVRPEGLTPRYAAPELFQGAPLTVRAEVFALGATLDEIVKAGKRKLPKEVRAALAGVIARATSTDPEARFPSVDEVANALRRAAQLPEPAPEESFVAWPIVGLDRAAAELGALINELRPGGGVMITGPSGAGKSTLLRRIAWSFGLERSVAWVEGGAAHDPDAALAIELDALDDDRGAAVILVDDADRLSDHATAKLHALRTDGAKIVLVVSGSGEEVSRALSGDTLQIFAMPALDPSLSGELVRRVVPSLGDAVVEHVVARAAGFPGKLRSILELLGRATVVVPADVDRLLGDEGVRVSRPSPDEVHDLIDRGYLDEAADALARWEGDASASIAIARARLYGNRGEPARALLELDRVADEVDASGDRALIVSFWLARARAFLRASDARNAEEAGSELQRRAGLSGGPGDDRLLAALPPNIQPLAVEGLSVRGLALSFASRHDEARAALEHAVDLARLLGDPRVLSIALSALAFALQKDDKLTEAKAAHEEALAAAEAAGAAGTVATTRLNLAGIAKTQGDLEAAIRHLEAAVDLGRRSGRVATLWQALLNLANLDLYLGRLARARVSLDALAEHGADLPPHHHAQLLALEAEHAARSGDFEAAATLCQKSAEAHHAMGRHIDEAEARLERVLVLASSRRGTEGDLRREVARAEALLGGTGAHRALLGLARLRVAAIAGQDDDARSAADEALDAARASGQRDWVWRALEARAALEEEAGQTQQARRDREEALSVLEEIASRLPRDLREVYWDDPRRKAVRAASMRDFVSAATTHFGVPGEDRLARILEINRAIAGEHDLNRLLEKVTDHAIALLRAERGFVILRSDRARAEGVPASGDARTGGLSVHASRGEEDGDPHARFSQSIADRVISTGDPVVTSNAREDARMADYVSVHQLMLRSVACVPIRARGGVVIGALYLEARLQQTSAFTEELPVLLAFADQVAIAIDAARLINENARRAAELAAANIELLAAREKLEEALGHRTAQLAATRRDLRSARAVLRGHFGYQGLVGTSQAMRRVYAIVDRVKDTDVPVLLTGESGTGKEMIARAIHNAGPRDKKTFVGINCGAIPEHLLESELFGHVRGAFTGADRDRRGLFREATEGTILLDEIGEMSQKMQAGLLRVLQEKVVRPVGGLREESVDTRVIAATHRDLAAMVGAGTFREDLYYRLHVIEIRVPPLRERLDDIPLLIDHFLGIFAARYSRERRSVSRAALKRLMGYAWPGNVRQLENVLLNAWVLSDEPELEIEHFELPSSRSITPRAEPAAAAPEPRAGTSLDEHRASERKRILDALNRANWNRVKAAQIVGLPRRTFYRRLKEYGIQ